MPRRLRTGPRGLVIASALACCVVVGSVVPVDAAPPTGASTAMDPSPTATPTDDPTATPTATPSTRPSPDPTEDPSVEPTGTPTGTPAGTPTGTAGADPSADPSAEPTSESPSEPTSDATTADEVAGDPGDTHPPGLLDLIQDVVGEAIATAQAEDETYPGLPALTGFQWDGVGTTGMTEVQPSLQFVRIPPTALAADVGVAIVPPPEGYTSSVLSTLRGYAVSPPGSEHPYGDFAPIRVRMLAFGALPVEATVRIAQLRDEEGLPIGLRGSQSNPINRTTGVTRYDDAPLEGQVQVRVSDIEVDGVPVDVGARCATREPATLTLVGRGFFRRASTYWELPIPTPSPETLLTIEEVRRDHYVQASGGLLTGTLDVPAFGGCVGRDGDLSALVTSAVAGDGQPVRARQSTTFTCFPPDKVTDCQIPDEFPYPGDPTQTPTVEPTPAG